MNRFARYFVFACLLSVCGLAARQPEPEPAEAKIRLLSEALHARDIGDIPTARKNLQALLTLTPNDNTVKRLLVGLERGPQRTVSVAGGTIAPPPPASDAASEADAIARAEEERINKLIEAAAGAAKEARALLKLNQLMEANAVVDHARATLPENNLTKDAVVELGIVHAEIAAARGKYLAGLSTAPPAKVTADAAVAGVADQGSLPASPRPATAPARVGDIRPVSSHDAVGALVARGRSQYLAGDSAAAAVTFRRVDALDAGNADARYFLTRIRDEATIVAHERARTSAQMLGEVNNAWQRPGVFNEKEIPGAPHAGPSPLLEKLNRIVLPSVNFSGMELSRVVNTLSMISEEFDATGATPKGVNVVLLDQGNANPTVSITLRNLPLKRVLDFITDSVGYQYEVQADAVVVRPGGEQSTLDTQFFPISRSTVLRMSGKAGSTNTISADPLKSGLAAAGPAASPTVEGEGRDIRNFLQLAGVSFDDAKGSSLAFDGSQLIVTQTPRNMDRIRNILTRYHDVRQVEIEAKFMEVQQGALEEFGVQWNIGKKAAQRSGASVSDYATSNRTLADAFTSNASGTTGGIVRADSASVDANGNVVTLPNSGINTPIVNNPPPIPGTNNLGLVANPLAAITGVIGEFNVNAVVRALAQKQGTELLSAPKLTVLSGNPATITVAQELRYPQSFGQVQSQVGTGSASGGGSAGVAITAGTPQEFTTRNVGVELKVTPTVEEDDYSISLDLNPKVTEFEGFVEYGGQSIAISGGTTVTVPSGFFQPIFGVREMATKVTIWDGATLVMGGLTREDVKSVSDKVPVLGNLPGIGRLFRSNGESTQKRNLLIFVTANLVSPGGSLKKQAVPGIEPGTLYQNPTIVTPAGPAPRGR